MLKKLFKYLDYISEVIKTMASIYEALNLLEMETYVGQGSIERNVV